MGSGIGVGIGSGTGSGFGGRVAGPFTDFDFSSQNGI